MNNKQQDALYLEWAHTIANGMRGAIKIDANGFMCAYNNEDGRYSYIKCLNDEKTMNEGATLYLTHGVNSTNAMQIVNEGIKRVVYVEEFGIGVGAELLKCMGVIVEKFKGGLK